MTEPNKAAPEQKNSIKEPAATYLRNSEIPTFFGQPMLKGKFYEFDAQTTGVNIPRLFYSHPNGEIWIGDAIA